jgi:predicted phage terminase large subunit-like protein
MGVVRMEGLKKDFLYIPALGKTIDKDFAKRKDIAGGLEKSLYKFLQAGWQYIDPSPFVPGAPIEAVCEHLEAVKNGHIKRLVINIPPRCAKSSTTSVAFPAWVWAQNKKGATSGAGVTFLHASYAQQLALRDSVKCRRLIESPFYQGLWGDEFKLMGDQNTKTRFDNSARGSRLATSVGSALTGEGGDIIVVDDPNAAQEAFSEATIESTIEWWDSALSTRLNNPKTGAFVVIQQRLSEQDLTGHIMEKDVGEWCHLMLPMRYEPERSFYNVIGWKDWREEAGELLWPERFGEREVNLLERQLGPWAAAGQLQQRPEPKGGGVIKREWWTLWEREEYPKFDYILAALDTAYTTKEENDPSAMTIWGVFSGGDQTAIANRVATKDGETMSVISRSYHEERHPQVMLIHAWQGRYELHELVKKVQESMRQYSVDKLLIENKAAGISVAQEIRRLYGHEDFSVQLVDPKSQDKLARLYSIQHLFAEGLIHAPDRSWADMTITQVGVFPKGKHDDLVDTVSMALRHLRELGMLVRGEERTAELNRDMDFKGREPEPLYGTV